MFETIISRLVRKVDVKVDPVDALYLGLFAIGLVALYFVLINA